MVVISNDRPAYRVLAIYGFFGPDDHLYNEGECIYFDGEPNEELEPLNDPARNKMIAYLEKLDKCGQEAALKFNRPWNGRPRDLDGMLQLAKYNEEYKLTVRGAGQKDNPGVEAVETPATPEVGSTNPKVKAKKGHKAELVIS